VTGAGGETPAGPIPDGAPPVGVIPEGLRPTPEDEQRRARLVAMQRVATAMLVAAGGAYAVALAWEPRHPWLAWVRAFAEAALVGGIADWFAVTALFRHPLGLPIPHTAIVPRRKERIGAALGNFVQRFFLAPDVVAGKLAGARPAARMGAWLAAPGNARRVARQVAGTLHGAAGALRDEDVQALVDRGVVDRLRRAPAAPLLARGVELFTAGGRHHALLDDALRLAARVLAENDALIRERIRAESPWWVPGKVEEKLGDRVVTAVERTLAAVAADPAHPLRQRYDEAVARFVASLREDPVTMARAETLARDLGGPVKPLAWESRHDALDGANLLVNTTSQGMVGQGTLDIALDRLPKTAVVSDIVYIPKETPLLEAARRRGNPTVNGLGMLLHQARPAWTSWFGITPEVTPEMRAMIEATL